MGLGALNHSPILAAVSHSGSEAAPHFAGAGGGHRASSPGVRRSSLQDRLFHPRRTTARRVITRAIGLSTAKPVSVPPGLLPRCVTAGQSLEAVTSPPQRGLGHRPRHLPRECGFSFFTRSV